MCPSEEVGVKLSIPLNNASKVRDRAGWGERDEERQEGGKKEGTKYKEGSMEERKNKEQKEGKHEIIESFNLL